MEQSNTTTSSVTQETTEQGLKRLAQQALQVQNACNMSGIAHSFAKAMSELRVLQPQLGTDALNSHPITRLWASKVHDLAGMGLSNSNRFSDALKACEELAK